jgi:hypothetical protein
MVVELTSTYLISIHSVSISRYNVNYVTVAKSPVCRWLPKGNNSLLHRFFHGIIVSST